MAVPSSGAHGSGRARDLYRWRGRQTPGASMLATLYQHRVKLLWSTLLFAALIFFAWLIWLLLFAPKRTPLLVLSAAPYSWPLPPNAWATEDVEKMAFLHGKSITLRGDDEPVRSKAGLIDRLTREIERGQNRNEKVPLIIWISMHGVGSPSSGDPRLVPPDASPTDAETMADIDDVISCLRKRIDRDTLLILDCHRMQVNWNTGLLINQFSERVRQALAAHDSGQLAVLLAAGPDEQAGVSEDLRGSVFAHYLRQGMAGAADNQVVGNQDGWISLLELHAYLKQRVNQWSLRHRATKQTPELLTSQANLDFRLVRSLNRKALTQLLDNDRKAKRAGLTVPVVRLDRLWQQMDEFRNLRLYQREPVAWRDLEHSLLWLEQLSVSGAGYYSMAQRTLNKVEGQVQSIQERVARMRKSREISDHCGVISGNTWRLPEMQMHTLPLAEYFGTVSPAAALELRDSLGRFAEEPNRNELPEAISTLQNNADVQLASGHFLRMLGRYQFAGFWQRTPSIGSLLELQADLRNLAVPRGRDGLPSDERVHGWTRQLVSHIDVHRREAEDTLFVQTQPSLTAPSAETNASVQEVLSAVQMLQNAMETCDQAMAETPYLAQWLTHPLRQDEADSTVQRDNRLLTLIADTAELSRRLADYAQAPTELASLLYTIKELDSFTSERVRRPLDSLSNDYDLQHAKLLAESETDNPQTVGELEAVLSIPVTRWHARRELRRALSQLAARLHANYDDQLGPLNEAPRQVAATPTASYADRIQAWEQHPLAAILGDEDVAESAGQNALEVVLADVASQLAELAQASTLAVQRAACSKAARRLRTVAPVWFPAPRRDPVSELRRIDLQSLLVWHAQRSLDDFWGPAGQDRAFFDLAATDYLAAASGLAPQRTEGQPLQDLPEIASLRRKLNAARQAASSWIVTTAGPAVQLDPSEGVTLLLQVKAASVQDDFQPPNGTAAVFIRDAETRRHEPDFEPVGEVALPPVAGADMAVTLPAAMARTGSALIAETMFRGHEYDRPLHVEPVGGVTVDLRPHQYQRSLVTLNSPWDQLSVVFILDCSQSMATPLTSQGEAAAGMSRLDAAKSALQQILFNLALRPNVRVGVHFFGHRLGWSTDEPLRPLARPDFPGVITSDLTPSQDVEPVLRLSDFDLTTGQDVIPRISAVKPWGQSPLYLSLVQALGDFGDADANADRHIIVITDGTNYQFIPETESNVQPTTVGQVKAAWDQQPVPIHVLSLAEGDQQEGVEELARLCRDTGAGEPEQLRDSLEDLTAALKRLLDPGTYQLAPDDPEGAQTSVLGTPIQRSAPDEKQRFWLSYEGRVSDDEDTELSQDSSLALEEVWLEGGESMQLYVSKDSTAIHAYPFQQNVAAEGELLDSRGEPTDHVFRLHRPFRGHQGHVTFPISWQQRDIGVATERWRVTHRPTEVWVEVQPLTAGDDNLGEEYVFFDANYEPEQPVPLLQPVARDWPQEAKKARIRLWCQPPQTAGYELLPPPADTLAGLELTPPNIPAAEATAMGFLKTIAVGDVMQSRVNVAPGVVLRADQRIVEAEGDQLLRLRFIFDFGPTAPSVASIKLRLRRGSEKPSRILRQFDLKHRLAVHTYYFDLSESERPAFIEVSNREYEIDGAWQQAEEVVVDISEPGGFVPVSTSDSGE